MINLPKYRGSLSCLGCPNLVNRGEDWQKAMINDGGFVGCAQAPI